jgi:hypothetical protein
MDSQTSPSDDELDYRPPNFDETGDDEGNIKV